MNRAKNRDIPLLEGIVPTMQLAKEAEERLAWQQEMLTRLSQHLSGMPGGGSLPKGLEDAFARLEESGETLEKHLRKYNRDFRTAEKILNGISDKKLRAFVVMKYLIGATDAEIRRELGISEYTLNRLKIKVERAENMKKTAWPDGAVENSEK